MEAGPERGETTTRGRFQHRSKPGVLGNDKIDGIDGVVVSNSFVYSLYM